MNRVMRRSVEYAFAHPEASRCVRARARAGDERGRHAPAHRAVRQRLLGRSRPSRARRAVRAARSSAARRRRASSPTAAFATRAVPARSVTCRSLMRSPDPPPPRESRAAAPRRRSAMPDRAAGCRLTSPRRCDRSGRRESRPIPVARAIFSFRTGLPHHDPMITSGAAAITCSLETMRSLPSCA